MQPSLPPFARTFRRMPSLLHETWFPPVAVAAVAAVALVGLSGRPLATSAMLMSIAPLAPLGGAWIVGRMRPRVFCPFTYATVGPIAGSVSV